MEISFLTVTEKSLPSIYLNKSDADSFLECGDVVSQPFCLRVLKCLYVASDYRSGNLVSGKFTITVHLLLTPAIFCRAQYFISDCASHSLYICLTVAFSCSLNLKALGWEG